MHICFLYSLCPNMGRAGLMIELKSCTCLSLVQSVRITKHRACASRLGGHSRAHCRNRSSPQGLLAIMMLCCDHPQEHVTHAKADPMYSLVFNIDGQNSSALTPACLHISTMVHNVLQNTRTRHGMAKGHQILAVRHYIIFELWPKILGLSTGCSKIRQLMPSHVDSDVHDGHGAFVCNDIHDIT